MDQNKVIGACAAKAVVVGLWVVGALVASAAGYLAYGYSQYKRSKAPVVTGKTAETV